MCSLYDEAVQGRKGNFPKVLVLAPQDRIVDELEEATEGLH